MTKMSAASSPGTSRTSPGLRDKGNGDKRKAVEVLKRPNVLKADHLLTMAGFLDRPEADIEDALEPRDLHRRPQRRLRSRRRLQG